MAEYVMFGFELGNKLIKAGLIPDMPVTRIVIDIQMDEPVKIFYETLAEKATLDLCLEELLKNKKYLNIKKVVT